MRAAVYARVSTEEQGDNFSIPSQIAAARRYASDRGWQVVAELTDTVSGAVLDRPGLRKLRDLIAARAIDAVVVYSLDRLSRNVAHMLLLRDEMHGAGVELHAVTRGQSADTAEGRLFDTIESAFAEYERLKIRERNTRGKRQKVQSGKILGCGITPPYGYAFVGRGKEKALVVNETEAAWVRTIFTWAADGVSLRSIAARLDAAGVPPTGNARHLAARGWKHDTIRYIIRNHVYRGEQVYEAYDARVPVPALVDDALWRAANERLDTNKQHACRVAKRVYPLRGRVQCASCGGRCFGAARPGRVYYICKAARERRRSCDRRAHANARRLEAAVWQWVIENVLDETRLVEAIDRANAGDAEARAALERERDAYARQVEDAEQRIARLVEAFTAGALTLDDFTTFKRRFDDQKAAAQRGLDRIEGLLRADAARRLDQEALLAYVRSVRAAAGNADLVQASPDIQMRVYAALGVQVVTDGATARVEARLTGDVGVLSGLSRATRHHAHCLTLAAILPLRAAA